MSPDTAPNPLTECVLGLRMTEETIRQQVQFIQRDLLAQSGYLRELNFTAIHPRDLEFLFDAYDARFLSGLCRHALSGRDLRFALSDRMTVSGGVTKRIRSRAGEIRYEIVIASGILFDGFREPGQGVLVCGLECTNRLEALQRIVEHELIHLIEHLCWDQSNCSKPRFHEIAARMFLHRAHTHNLMTRRELAARSGFRRGSQVSFEFEGRRLSGRVVRITKRATVLVEDPGGARYTDGRNYKAYYVPISALN